jgi:hypothetical protein
MSRIGWYILGLYILLFRRSNEGYHVVISRIFLAQ